MFRKLAASTLLVASLGLAGPAVAGEAPLFVNLTTSVDHRAHMALHFGAKQAELGHPVTIFLNDEGVKLASRTHADKYPRQQKAIRQFIANGHQVIVCPMCMDAHGVKKEDLIDGLTFGNPEVTGKALFAPDTRTLSY